MVTSLGLSIFGLTKERAEEESTFPSSSAHPRAEDFMGSESLDTGMILASSPKSPGKPHRSLLVLVFDSDTLLSTQPLIYRPTDTPNSTCRKLTCSPRMASSLVMYLSWRLDEVLLYSTQKPGCLPPPYTHVTCQFSLPNLCLSPTSSHPVLVCVTLHLYFCKCFLVAFPCPGSLPPPLPVLCPALTLFPIIHISTRRISWGKKKIHQLIPLLQTVQRLQSVFKRKLKALSTASKTLSWFLSFSTFCLKFYTLHITYSPNIPVPLWKRYCF